MPQPPLDSDIGEVRKRPLDPAGAEASGIAHEHRPHAPNAPHGTAHLRERADPEDHLRNQELADTPA